MPPTILSAGSGLYTVNLHLDDVDGDGRLDLLVTCPSAAGVTNPRVLLYLQVPGGFSPPVSMMLAGQPSEVRTTDLDGDGDRDVLIASYGSFASSVLDSVIAFAQISPGVFSMGTILDVVSASDTRPAYLRIADVDGDGEDDILSGDVSGSSGGGYAFYRSSPRLFSRATIVDSPQSNGPCALAAGDLDGDGDTDLAVANREGDTVQIFLQGTPGRLSPGQVVGGAAVSDGPYDVALADIDGDGDLDVVSANYQSPNLTIFRQTSAGQFDPNPIVLSHASLQVPECVAVGDVDGDGDTDIVSACSQGASPFHVAVFFQTSPAAFSPVFLTMAGTGAPDVALGDLNGDGALDIVACRRSSSTLSVFFQIPHGAFVTPPLALALAPSSEPIRVAVGDLDGDGDNDIACANYRADNAAIFFQTASGSFSAAPTLLADGVYTTRLEDVVLADVDGDGDLDIVTTGYINLNGYAATVRVFFQTAPGTFLTTTTQLTGGVNGGDPIMDAYGVVVADFDSDGWLDVASANWQSDNIAVFFKR